MMQNSEDAMRRGGILVRSGICDICGAYGPHRDKVVLFSKGERHLYICVGCMMSAIRMMERTYPKGEGEEIASSDASGLV